MLSRLKENAAPKVGVTSLWIISISIAALIGAIASCDLATIVLFGTQVYIQLMLRLYGRIRLSIQTAIVAILVCDVVYLCYRAAL